MSLAFENIVNFLGNPILVTTVACVDILLTESGLKRKIMLSLTIAFIGIISFYFDYNLIGAAAVVLPLAIWHLLTWPKQRKGTDKLKTGA
jgi:hypothetical protein